MTGQGRGVTLSASGLHEFVMGQLPQNEIIEDALRKHVKLLPDASVRELIANALVHQNFLIGGAAPIIEVYSNRVEISNPGEPIVPVERFIDGYQSPNERLASMMRRMSICEEKGSGIDRVVQEAEIFQLPAPEFRAGHRRTIVTIFGPKPFDDMDREERMRACYQHCALRWVMAERMTNQSLRLRFGLPESKAAVRHRSSQPRRMPGGLSQIRRWAAHESMPDIYRSGPSIAIHGTTAESRH